MAVPTITAMPAAPSRIGDPTNFFSESLAFLDAQPDLQAECNDVADYLNAAMFNANNWGLITESPAGGTPAAISDFPDAAPTNPPLTGYDLIAAIDDMMASINPFITDANAVATFIDGYSDPLAPVVSDPARPTISQVAASQARTDSPTAFETKAVAFYNSLRAFAFLLNDLSTYTVTYLSGTEDWSSIAIAYTSSEDWGSIV